jgi:type II secretory pathway component PulC
MWSNGAWLNRSLWLASLLLVFLIAVLGATMVQSYRRVTHLVPDAFAPSPPTSLPETLTPAVLADYQSIAARNLFHATPAQPPAPPPPAPSVVQPLPAQPGLLKLVGVIARTTGPQYVIIEDLSQRSAQAVYEIGDSIQQAFITAISPTCVVLAHGEQATRLCLP